MQSKLWVFKNKTLQPNKITEMAEKYHLPKIIATLLLNRNLFNEEDVKSYMTKSMRGVHNPNLMPGMDKAVERIKKALDDNEKIVVYGDYDVDGITSTAVLYEFLSEHGANAEYYIPDRYQEGYGINIMAVNKLAKAGTKLLITVDCGITAVGEVSLAKVLGMDCIITDHHTCKEKLPEDAVAIINPKIPECDYPFDGLAGVGVAFKLVLAIAMAMGESATECFNKYCDLAALGTVADVVPLLDENRIIVDRGLKALANTQREGVKKILEISGADKRPLNASSIAFTLAPRINAAGRLGNASTAVELLLCRDSQRAYEISLMLDKENRERQIMEQEIFDEAIELINNDPNFEKKKVVVLAKEGWHHGVIGIVASRINNKFYRPCILISYENGVGKGSGRSIPTFNLFEALSSCGDLLTNFGGHAIAAGLNINSSDVEEFTKKINEYADKILTEEDMIPRVDIDCWLNPASVSIKSCKTLAMFEPFGMCNEKPVFAISNQQITAIGQMGLDNKHLRLRAGTENMILNCVGFGMGEYYNHFHLGDYVDLAFQMDINNYQGTEQVQLVLKDIRASKGNIGAGYEKRGV